MKIITAQQIKEADAATILAEPIRSVDLMERAAMVCVKRLVKLVSPNDKIIVLCGKGNNGGDGLAITRLLLDHGFNCTSLIVNHSPAFSPDAQINHERLTEKYPSKVLTIENTSTIVEQTNGYEICIDALLGTGLNRAVEDLLAEVIEVINYRFKKIISIDVPSGLFCDGSSANTKSVVHSTLTLSFQLPKLAFLLPQNAAFVPEFEILDIKLDPKKLSETTTKNYYITKSLVASLFKPRNKFSHKGTYGHALLLAGSKGKEGAAVISAKAAMRSGAGLLTVHSNQQTVSTLLCHLPESMTETDSHPDFISEIIKPENYDAIAFGPGTGRNNETQLVLKKILHYYSGKLLIDADGLNILSENKTWLNFLPPDSILTPHPKEFERLCGKAEDDFNRLDLLREFCIKHRCITILKGAHSAIAMPDGNIFFNSSGNAGLAKAGSGDGLTGIILGLLCRGYSPPQAAIIGTFIHGYAADIYGSKKSKESLLISDVIELLPKAFKKLENLASTPERELLD